MEKWKTWLNYMNEKHDLQYRMATGSSPYGALESILSSNNIKEPKELIYVDKKSSATNRECGKIGTKVSE